MLEQVQLTLSVGVTGHRPNKLGGTDLARLRRDVRQLVAELRRAVDESGPARLRIVSPLAEGADRIVATEALGEGAELVVLLPFTRESYILDFVGGNSRAEFRRLLGLASEVIELNGRHDTEESRNSAYADVGALIVERSDLLIAVWDGRPVSGTGGTAEIIKLAKRRGRPVAWLSTSNGKGEALPLRLLLGGETVTTNAAERLFAIAKDVLARP